MHPVVHRSLLALALVPVPVSTGLLAAGCVASTEDAASESDALNVRPPPVTPPTKGLPSPPSAPPTYSFTPSAMSVLVKWVSPDATADQFVVYRRDASWNWQQLHVEPNKAGATFTWPDSDHGVSAQCYLIVAVSSSTGMSTATKEQCTVRPDPSAFPQSAPAATIEWSGLAFTNDLAAPLSVGNDFLQTQSRTWGVSLGLGPSTGNNAKGERQGDGSTWPLMKGEAIAIRVWGAGWLAHGTQSFGVDLVLSDTPVYEWYVVGNGTPGQNLDNSTFALWNKSAGDYLVKGDQTWGVGLNWYQKTLPPPSGSGTKPPPGVKELDVTNCISQQRPLEMWVDDVTAGSGWVDEGTLDTQWTAVNGCPSTGSPWVFKPTTGHSYIVRAIDFTVPGCDGIDVSTCIRGTTSFVGDAKGVVVPFPLG